MRGWPTLRPLYADVAQLVEATDLSSVKCGFESHHRYHIRLRQISLQELKHATVLFLQLPFINVEVTQLVEYLPSKQTAAGSSPVFHSIGAPPPSIFSFIEKCGSSMRGLDMTSRLIRASLRSLRQWAFGRSTKMYPAKKDKDHIICRGHIVVSMRH